MLGPIRRVRFTRAATRQAIIRENEGAKDNRDYMNLVQKSCQVFSSVMYGMRCESGTDTLWLQIEELEEMDACRTPRQKAQWQRKC